jgi:hypothetical protein
VKSREGPVVVVMNKYHQGILFETLAALNESIFKIEKKVNWACMRTGGEGDIWA